VRSFALAIAALCVVGISWSARADAVRHESLRQLGGNFTLTDQFGQRFSLEDARGKVVLLSFGFTACASTCPLTMSKLTAAMEQLGPLAERVQPLLISIDPKRDTPEVLQRYLRNFHPGIRGLTGTKAEIDDVTAKFRAPAHAHIPEPGGAYQVDHSSYLFVVDTHGTLVRLIRLEESAGKIARVAKALLEEPPASPEKGDAHGGGR
jgi:protein SCO1/2